MPKVGTLVRVLYPEYAKGIEGIIEAKEERGRWIVRLEKNSLNENPEPWLLSLEESDFEVISSEEEFPS
ncbi:hypothetical protein IQ238_13260 [Pleurocapsales cyanobacterium LEGE 06147]|nr:hypothetical protein [Pleurocapsales cyanobacterium LEGE 06147]